jgi:hypothetical protein
MYDFATDPVRNFLIYEENLFSFYQCIELNFWNYLYSDLTDLVAWRALFSNYQMGKGVHVLSRKVVFSRERNLPEKKNQEFACLVI